jgi:hypothetical protein
MKIELEPGRRAERSGTAASATGGEGWATVRACASELERFTRSCFHGYSSYSKVMQHRIVGRTRHDVCFAELHVSRPMAKLGILH